jgi:hypothetical protein
VVRIAENIDGEIGNEREREKGQAIIIEKKGWRERKREIMRMRHRENHNNRGRHRENKLGPSLREFFSP